MVEPKILLYVLEIKFELHQKLDVLRKEYGDSDEFDEAYLVTARKLVTFVALIRKRQR